MGINFSIDITAGQRKDILALLERHLPDTKAWAYGSRVSWTSRPQSDIDMVVFATPEQKRAVSDLREALEESSLPFRVDLFVWDDVPGSFRKQIERDHVVLAKPLVPANHWHRIRLGECTVMNEATYSPKEDWPFVNYLDTGSITDNRIERIQCLKLNKDKLPDRARRKIEPGDIVFSTVRPNQRHFGLLRDVPENFLASTGFAVFRAREDIADTGFIYWFLVQERIINQLHTIAEHSTSAYPSIRPSDIKNLNIDLPPLPEQRAIAGILGALDDKIALNRRMNGTLEAMARAIFKDWFVDFGPVRAKMEGRAPYLPPEIWKLFPDRFANSEIGEIPEGWEVSPLDDLISVNPLRRLPKGQTAPYLDMANMPAKGHIPDTISARPFGSGTKFMNGDTLMARITPCLENGKTAYVDFLQEGEVGWGSTEYIVLRPKSPLPYEFAYCLARSFRFREFAIQNMTGTSGRQRVQAQALQKFPLACPTEQVAVAFGNLVRPPIARASAASRQSHSLVGILHGLLPKLMSGEVRLRDAEQIVGEIA